MNNRSSKTKNLILISLFTALICISAQITLPIPVVPLTGQTLAIGLCATVLGSRKGAAAAGLYVLIGAAGLPVYSGFTGGIGILFGPTGGYLFSFIPAAYLIGFITERTGHALSPAIFANLAGMAVNLSAGTCWLAMAAGLPWNAAILSGTVPFLIPGIVKALLAAWLGTEVLKRLRAGGMLAGPNMV